MATVILTRRHVYKNGGASYGRDGVRASVYVGPRMFTKGTAAPDMIEFGTDNLAEPVNEETAKAERKAASEAKVAATKAAKAEESAAKKAAKQAERDAAKQAKADEKAAKAKAREEAKAAKAAEKNAPPIHASGDVANQPQA